MKNFKLKFATIAIILALFSSCLVDDDVTDFGAGTRIIEFPLSTVDGTFDIGMDEFEFQASARLVGGNGSPAPSDIVVTYEVDQSKTTAIEGTNFTILNNGTFTLLAGDTDVIFPILIIPSSLDPELSVPLTIALKLTSATANFPVGVSTKESTSTVVINLKPLCPITDDLSGTHTYTQTSMQYGDGTGNGTGTGIAGTISGSVTWTEAEPGKYSLDDASFGLFEAIYDDDPAVGPDGAFLTWVCREFLFSGSDQYSDTFTYNIISVTGPVMVFTWRNTWGDGGTVTLTREGGVDWPDIFQTN
ncbi:hypothetical protein ABH942_002356 [Flavobacterium sp. 28YEA47A]|uniref:hypothetical protein n=1 Tax=Flavobacterium sp. 28YEA47A TaxID=3156276 RepID=UPI003511075E